MEFQEVLVLLLFGGVALMAIDKLIGMFGRKIVLIPLAIVAWIWLSYVGYRTLGAEPEPRDENFAEQLDLELRVVHEFDNGTVLWRGDYGRLSIITAELARERQERMWAATADEAEGRPMSETEREGQAVASAVAELPERRVDYNRPDTLPFGEPSEITLVIGADSREEGQEALIGRQGEKIEVSLGLATKVIARLDASEDSAVIGPEPVREITIIPGQTTEVTWRVTPISTEPFFVSLELENLVMVEGREFPVRQRVFSDRFEVTTTTGDRVMNFVQSTEGFWSMLGVLGPVAVWLFSLAWRRRKESTANEAAPDLV